MPTPLCDDQCLRRLCKMAAAKPTHYYESLALHFYPSSSSLLSKEVPSVSDSGASAIYSECSKQICHFCISRAWMLAYYHWQGLFVVMRDIKRGVIYILFHLHFSSQLHALF